VSPICVFGGFAINHVRDFGVHENYLYQLLHLNTTSYRFLKCSMYLELHRAHIRDVAFVAYSRGCSLS
jgi:hypothetical protein